MILLLHGGPHDGTKITVKSWPETEDMAFDPEPPGHPGVVSCLDGCHIAVGTAMYRRAASARVTVDAWKSNGIPVAFVYTGRMRWPAS